MRRNKGFTLLEVLISVGVLFIIGSAILSLSNTLIQGTVSTADTTITNLWAAEGLELVSKNRDDRFHEDPSQPWLAAALTHNEYGWYTVALSGNRVALEKATINGSNTLLDITMQQAFEADNSNLLTSENLSARRLICIEALGVSSLNAEPNSDRLRCNMDQTNGRFNDGSRNSLALCSANDLYCSMTRDSLNRNNVRGVLIPAGNAVKVRSVVVWQSQSGFQTAEMGTILTNWRSVGH